MKKLIAVTTLLALSTATLCACSPKPNPKDSESPPSPKTYESFEPDTFDRSGTWDKPNFPGVRRYLDESDGMSETGIYYLEYVHFPVGTERDESIDYRLDLRDDGMFTFDVVTNNVSATHEGRWYGKNGGEIILFYDEPIADTAHNVYVSDCMFCEYLPSGKIMLYDNCNTVVLSKDATLYN